jgi:hypothetical protein
LAISITRRLIYQLRAVMRRGFGSRSPGPAVCFTAAAGTLSVKAGTYDIAVAYTGPGDGTAEGLWLPFEFLADCEGKKDDPVELTAASKGRVTAQWRDGSVPQIVRYEAKAPAGADKFPAVPPTLVENPSRILQALADAADTCDPESIRFALGHIQLRGEHGTIVATDGRQLLVQNGFQFPWTGDLLVPRSKVFASAELPHDLPVQVGKAENWVAIGVGPWVIYLAVNVDGRFPDVLRQIPNADAVRARCSFGQADADFLIETLPRLPSDDDYNHAVTLDLNGQIAVRAKGPDSPRPTEVVLRGASFSGEPMRLNINRKYLLRALRLGLREVNVTGDKSAILACDATRKHVFMPLGPESAIPPAEDAVRIESPMAVNASHPPVKPKRRTAKVSTSATNPDPSGGQPAPANGHAKANSHTKTNGQARKATGAQQDIDGLMEQADTLRMALRDALLKTNELLKGLKRHRRQSRALQNTIAMLRQLKTLGV